MTWLSDDAVNRLRQVVDAPDLTHTKYEVVERIGRGGMGSVYAARDRELDRIVAIKVLSIPNSDHDAVSRMLREAKILARLEHPAIVPVHDVGVLPDGRVFYAMKLVRGERLDEYARQSRAIPERLRVFERICEAVAFAHAAGVVHRDLKPQNVMVGSFGEVLVMDWGVAKLLGERPTAGAPPVTPLQGLNPGDPVTDHGTVLGTPGYMAPEQAAGQVAQIDERTDVYALGSILRFLLTGWTPPATRADAQVGGIRREITKPLTAITTKALANDPAARYQSVAELAADIARYLNGERVTAYREGIVERVRRVASKYRTPILLVLAYLIMRILLLVFAGA